jgi:adenine-specific DNA-methyltransferase
LPAPDGSQAWPIRNDGQEGHWRWGKNNPAIYLALKDPDVFHWEKRPFDKGKSYKGKEERWTPYEKNRETKKGIGWGTWLDSHGYNADGTRELKEIFGIKVFDTPKPTQLFKWIISLHSNLDAVVLDSFAGSAVTSHAVLQANQDDGGNRKFVLVQMPEAIKKDQPAWSMGFREIIDITAERTRRVICGYKFEGTQHEELMREPITLTALKKANELLERANSFDLLDKHRFDCITKSVEDGVLVVNGEKKITEKVEGLGGSFTFCTLGEEMGIDRLLAGKKLPSFDALAKYVFYTATGRTLADVTKQKADGDGFIGETEFYRVHLYYKPEKKWLASNDAALTEQLVEKMLASNKSKKRLLVFAAAKFMAQKELTRQGVEFCQLPYAIHRILGD